MSDATDEIHVSTEGHASASQRRLPLPLLAGWIATIAVAIGSTGTFALMFGMFNRPHAFGARDGQGAAAIAALLMLVAGGIALPSVIVAAVLGGKLRARGLGWATKVALVLPLLAGVAGLVVSLVA